MSKKKVKISDLIIPKLQPIWNDKEHAHIIITSGRAGTKSSWIGMKMPFEIINQDACSAVVMRKFHNKLKKTVYKEVLRGINRLKVSKKKFKITSSPMEIKYKKKGNTIYFTGNDSIDDTKGMIDENKPIKFVVLDELTEFFDKGDGEDEIANIEATFVRGNDEQFQMIYLFNPPKNKNAPIMKWLEKMKKRDDTIHIHIDYRDVPRSWLGEKLIKAAEAMKKVDELMYNWVWLGLCTGLSEVVYYMFDEVKHILHEQNLKKLIHIGIGVDYGQLNATTFEAFGMNPEKMRIEGIDEYYHSGRDSGKQKTPSDYAKDFKEFYKKVELKTGKRIEAVFIDPSARGFAEEIKRIMPGINIIPANNKVALGIERTQKLFSFLKLFICPLQTMLLEEIGLYKYDKKKVDKGKEEVVKDSDHCADALRYYIMGMWKYAKFLLPQTERGE